MDTDFPNPLDYALSRLSEETVRAVEEAIDRGQVTLAFQPVVQAAHPDRTAFWEALVRIPDAGGRILSASEFLPTVETQLLGRKLDTLAIAKGCELLASAPNLRLSVNMSARSIGYGPWMDRLEHWLQHDSTLGPRLILELTESSVVGLPDLVTDFMDRLQPHGVCFCLDDFGLGHTMLRHFRDLYFDMLKIDGSFIKGIEANPDNKTLVAAMTGLAHQFDMLCIASRVESADAAQTLTALRLDCLQGFHFGAATLTPPVQSNAPSGLRRSA